MYAGYGNITTHTRICCMYTVNYY